MQASPLSPAAKHSAGFTLIELLVVVAVIAILAGLLLPMFGAIENRARKVQAINEMRNIKVAVISYYTDYRKYPLNDVQKQASSPDYGSYDTVYGDPGGLYSTADLFDILRAVADTSHNQNNELNPSQSVYWAGPLVKNPKSPHNGITTQNFYDTGNLVPKGSLVDPWGNQYVIWVDANNDGDLSTAANWFYSDVQPVPNGASGEVHPGIAPMGTECASLGPDGEWGTKENGILKGSDDIVTW